MAWLPVPSRLIETEISVSLVLRAMLAVRMGSSGVRRLLADRHPSVKIG
jgi:hypothetical protein